VRFAAPENDQPWDCRKRPKTTRIEGEAMTVDRAPRSMEIPVELPIADDHELVRRGLIRTVI
jgi:hypothetical protein